VEREACEGAQAAHSPSTKRVAERKRKMEAGSELMGTAKAEKRAPQTDSAIVSCSARLRPSQSPT